jgi:hypothetical protein
MSLLDITLVAEIQKYQKSSTTVELNRLKKKKRKKKNKRKTNAPS